MTDKIVDRRRGKSKSDSDLVYDPDVYW
jgi:hypothetical protein